MTDKDFVETMVVSRRVYDGRLLQVYRDEVRLPNGRLSAREYIRHPGAAVVIPYLNDGNILMIRQYRYPVGEIMLELPAGKIDPGESPADTVRREMTEETGFLPQQITEIGLIHTCVGYSSEKLFLFWAAV
jgi:ADP-ribose pyrophosphatase